MNLPRDQECPLDLAEKISRRTTKVLSPPVSTAWCVPSEHVAQQFGLLGHASSYLPSVFNGVEYALLRGATKHLKDMTVCVALIVPMKDD